MIPNYNNFITCCSFFRSVQWRERLKKRKRTLTTCLKKVSSNVSIFSVNTIRCVCKARGDNTRIINVIIILNKYYVVFNVSNERTSERHIHTHPTRRRKRRKGRNNSQSKKIMYLIILFHSLLQEFIIMMIIRYWYILKYVLNFRHFQRISDGMMMIRMCVSHTEEYVCLSWHVLATPKVFARLECKNRQKIRKKCVFFWVLTCSIW